MRIGIVARVDVEEAVELANKIINFLEKKGVGIVLDKTLALKLDKSLEMASELEDMEADTIHSFYRPRTAAQETMPHREILF